MKGLIMLYLFLNCCVTADCQGFENHSLQIPVSATYSSISIAQYIKANFKTDRQKVEAIYSWVTTNISYNKDSMYNINWGPDPDLKVTAALRRKKGVCENFAAVFTDINLKCEIRSFVITGYTTQSKVGHSWSAVFIDNQWLLCDPTWDIGAGNNPKYFLLEPEQFIESHMPFDPLWQLLAYPVATKQYSRGIFTSKKNAVAWNVGDSVKAFLQLDSLLQLEASSERIRAAGLQDNNINIWHSYVDMKIAIAYGDKDMNLYNSAVEDLNKASKIFNAYVQYRNNQFTPYKSDAAISVLLEPLPVYITSAYKKISKMGEKIENLQYDTGTILNRLGILSAKVLEQQKFLTKYFQSNVADRGRMFYK